MNKKKKIAIIHNLPKGGGLRMITDVAKRYREKFDIEFYVVSNLKNKRIKNTKSHFYHVVPWKGFLGYNLWIIFVLPLIHKKIAKTIEWEKYDYVLFTHDYFTKSPYLLKYSKANNKYYLCQEAQREFYEPIEYHSRGLKEYVSRFLRYPIKWIDQDNVKYANKLFCNSQYSKKTLQKIYKKRFEVIYPGVNENFFSPTKEIKENIIICVGGINTTKNQEFLSRSLRPILDYYQLILIGNVDKTIGNKIKRIHKNIKFLSNISDKKLRTMYRKAKLTCVTAHREPFGLSSIESQSCGTPVVTIDDGGTPETIINGKTGYISKKDEKDFLNKVNLVLDGNEKMREWARTNVVENWTTNITLRKLDKFFQT